MQMENHRFLSPRNINTLGTLFGGDLLRWFDEEAALFAYECLEDQQPKRMTGVAIYSFNFLKPAYANNRIRSQWQIVHVGKTSLTVKGIYEAWQLDADDFQQKWVKIAEGYSCLCAITAEGKPTTYVLKPEINFEEIKSNKEWGIVENFKALTRLNK
jgi:acyl-CoA hydrolase